MNRAAELVHDAVTLLQSHGFAPAISSGGKHLKVRWVDQGRRFTLVISQSPGDHRSRVNSLATLRRILRGSNNGRHP
jgi:hypothetical protein